MLILLNFVVQIFTDLVASKYIDKIGYRISVVAAHFLAFIGLVCLGILPQVMAPFPGLIIATVLTAIGGGLTEVIVSPIVEALPFKKKSSLMSLLHSFYCWGQVAVVLLSTLYFVTIGTKTWYYLPIVWSLLPFFNMLLFAKVPIRTLAEGADQVPLRKLFSTKIFWLFAIMMTCAGASELAMSQWSSLFAELGLSVSKTTGDLLGPCAFALLMGCSRLYYGLNSSKINLKRALVLSSILCIFSYLLTALSPNPLLSLTGCALCGFSVGLMWPGLYSLSAKSYPQGGTAMFGILALAGDVGCAIGPSLTGEISNTVANAKDFVFANIFTYTTPIELGLKAGLFCVVIFPLIMLVSVLLLKKIMRRNKNV
ncbi:MAG: MFS transporter, partial [Oscillospiraceae bacterium]